jgi:general secretion pathway protein D
MSLRRIAALACTAVGFAHGTAAETETGTIRLRFDNAPLAQVIREVSRQTGAQYLFDEELARARVTISGYDLLTPEEAQRVLEAALLVNQLAPIESASGVTKIVPLDLSLAEAPFLAREPGDREAPVTTLLHLRNAPVAEVFRVVQPWLSGRAVAIPWAPTNALVLAGSELRLRTTFALVRALDEKPERELMVRRLRYRGAEELTSALDAAFGSESKRRAPLSVWSDPRSESVIALGTPRAIDDARDLLSRLDRPPELLGRLAIVPIRFGDAETIAETLSQLASGGKDDAAGKAIGSASLAGRTLGVTADPETRQLLLSGDPDTLRIARRVIDALDQEPASVSIDASIVEVSLAEDLVLGVDFVTRQGFPNGVIAISGINREGGLLDIPGLSPTTATGLARVGAQFVTVTDPTDATRTITVPQTDGEIIALGSTIQTRVYMRPHLTVLSGEKHTLFVGDNVPIPVSQAGAAAGGPTSAGAESADTETELSTAIRETIERQDVGVRVELEPLVGREGGVQIQVAIEVTELAPSSAVGAVEEVGPTIRNRKFETVLRLADGEQRTLAGLRDPRVTVERRGIPFLSAVPVLGRLFERRAETLRQSWLVVALRAQIQRRPEELVADTIRRRLAFERATSRAGELRELGDSSYSVRVTTRRLRADAESLAEAFGSAEHPGRVARFETDGEERFDVVLVGYESFDAAGDAAFALRARGFEPEVVVNPDALAGAIP